MIETIKVLFVNGPLASRCKDITTLSVTMLPEEITVEVHYVYARQLKSEKTTYSPTGCFEGVWHYQVVE